MNESKVSLVDLLLRPELPNVARELPTKKVKLSRISRLLGENVVFTLRGLPYGRVQELLRLSEDLEGHILLAGCADPDLKSPALMERFGGPTPLDAHKAMLMPGEITEMSQEVETRCG